MAQIDVDRLLGDPVSEPLVALLRRWAEAANADPDTAGTRWGVNAVDGGGIVRVNAGIQEVLSARLTDEGWWVSLGMAGVASGDDFAPVSELDFATREYGKPPVAELWAEGPLESIEMLLAHPRAQAGVSLLLEQATSRPLMKENWSNAMLTSQITGASAQSAEESMAISTYWQTYGLWALLEILAEYDRPVYRKELRERLADRLKPSGEAALLDARGFPRWWNFIAWGTTDLGAAGWMRKHSGGFWEITDAGRKALSDFPTPAALRAEAKRCYKANRLRIKELATRRAWLVRGSSVLGANLVPTWLEEDWCSLSASQLPRVDPSIDRDELAQLAEQSYEHLKSRERREKVEEIVDFIARMKPGDVVLTTSDARAFLGDVTGAAEYHASEGGRSNLRRSVDWRGSDGIDFGDLPARLQARLKTGATIAELTNLLPQLDQLDGFDTSDEDDETDKGEGDEDGETIQIALPHQSFPRLSPEVATELFVDPAWLDEFVDVLNERRQVVLYGPPGTGKTFLARKIAAHLAGEQQVRLVQFHPSYSYEDFFEGFRPGDAVTGSVTLELRPGPLRRLADEAREHPDQAFVLVIDELNRANLAKVFGELYFLLEYRDQAVELLYGGDPFTLPPNLYFIGTMNTADRSIALLDAAMRRRFAFIELHPATEPTASLLGQWLERNSLPDLAGRLLNELNRRIDDRDAHIGPSYFMHPDQSPERLARIWRTQITPLLQEYHYDQWDSVSQRFSFDSVRRAATKQPELPPDLLGEPATDVP